MADSASGMSKALATTTSFIEKAVELRHFMLLASFILALDSCLVVFFNKNLLGAFANLDAPEVNAGNAIVFLGFFAFMMTLLFPVLRQVLLIVPTYISSRWPAKDHMENVWAPDMLWASSAHRRALLERDKVVLELLEKKQMDENENVVTKNVGFAMIALFLFNHQVLGDGQTATLSQVAAALLDTSPGFWITVVIRLSLGIFSIFCAIMFFISLTPTPIESKIYLPESEEERKAREQRENRRLGL
ncbi:hypothetical protein V2K66_18650 [Pseudomonas alliivorans]|nr:hypothetical protein [Pseudomonas alliivorans]